MIDKGYENELLPIMIDCKLGRSNHYTSSTSYQYFEPQKNPNRNCLNYLQLYQILKNCNFGRLLISKSPAKSLKPN